MYAFTVLVLLLHFRFVFVFVCFILAFFGGFVCLFVDVVILILIYAFIVLVLF